MSISIQIKEMIKDSSYIRKMFEEGIIIKKKYGDNNICDFTIGNPNLEPPKSFSKTVKKIINQKISGKHGYMPNIGYKFVRDKIATRVSVEQETDLTGDHIVMTCGAGGGINIILRTILNPGDNVITPVPYFVEYKNYVANYNANLKLIKSKKNFNLDLVEIENAIDSKTAAIIINSPNNPSGIIYPENTIKELGRILRIKSEEIGRTIYLISDEPYRKLPSTI